MEPLALPPPYRGQQDNVPLVEVLSPYAEKVQNFNHDDSASRLRHGDSVWATKASAFPLNLSTYGIGSAQKLFIAYDSGGAGIKFAEGTAGGAMSDVYSPGGAGGDDEIHTLYFNNVLTFFGEFTLTPSGVGNPQYNGSAWGLSGYTYGGSFLPFGGTAYKNRAYIIGRYSTKYSYGGINAISGATTEVDLAQIISSAGYLYGIRSVSLSEGLEQENVLCFLFSSGEVLAYAGSYPNSADWKLVGRFVISPPIYYNAFVDANGDSYVITSAGLISLRALFTQGVRVATVQPLSYAIQNRWEQVLGFDWAAVSKEIFIKGVFDQKRNRIIIFLPSYIDEDGAEDTLNGLRLVYSFKTNSWSEHKLKQAPTVTSATYFKKASYYGQTGGIMKVEGASGFTDEQIDGDPDVGIEFDLISGPIAKGRANVARATGLDVIVETDMYSEAYYSFIRDLGVSSTTPQLVPSQGSTLQKPNANIGIEGSYIQYRINGTTTSGKTVGYNLYGVNVWAETGRSPR